MAVSVFCYTLNNTDPLADKYDYASQGRD